MWVGTNNGLEFDKKDGFERNNVLDFTGEKKKMGVKMNHGFEFGKKRMGLWAMVESRNPQWWSKLELRMKTDRYNLVEMAYNTLNIRSGIKYKR